MSIVITSWEYLFEKNFDEQKFENRDSRLMDKQTKITVSMARQFYAKVNGDEISPEDLGVVLLNDTGPLESIQEYNSILKEKGYVGVNPSKFPNIMTATPLARIVMDIKAKGPCMPLLHPKAGKHAFIYAIEQITAGRCRAMMLIHITERNDCFACFIEENKSCVKRGLQPRLIINEKG